MFYHYGRFQRACILGLMDNITPVSERDCSQAVTIYASLSMCGALEHDLLRADHAPTAGRY